MGCNHFLYLKLLACNTDLKWSNFNVVLMKWFISLQLICLSNCSFWIKVLLEKNKTCNDVRNRGIWQLDHQREETSLVETYPWNRWDKNCILIIQSSQWKLWNRAFETPFRTCVTVVGVLLAAGGSNSISWQHIRNLKIGRSFSCCLP